MRLINQSYSAFVDRSILFHCPSRTSQWLWAFAFVVHQILSWSIRYLFAIFLRLASWQLKKGSWVKNSLQKVNIEYCMTTVYLLTCISQSNHFDFRVKRILVEFYSWSNIHVVIWKTITTNFRYNKHEFWKRLWGCWIESNFITEMIRIRFF